MSKKIYFLVLLALVFSCKTKTEPDAKINNEVVQWKKNPDSLYSFKLGNLEVQIDALHAGKISSVRLDQNEFLIQSSVNATNWGNSLWPSPQSLWGWPPSAELDKNAYKVFANDSVLTLESQKDSKLEIIFKKSYQLLKDDRLKINYTIINESANTLKMAPWEITRVAPGGMTIWPVGDTAKRGDLKPFLAMKDSIIWFNYPTGNIPGGVPKLFSDGAEGWMAQFKGGYVLVKKFEDIKLEDHAAGEAEIELYANPDGTYIEIEQQGKYVDLAPQQTIQYTVVWKLAKTPQTTYQVGDASLITFIRSLLK